MRRHGPTALRCSEEKHAGASWMAAAVRAGKRWQEIRELRVESQACTAVQMGGGGSAEGSLPSQPQRHGVLAGQPVSPVGVHGRVDAQVGQQDERSARRQGGGPPAPPRPPPAPRCKCGHAVRPGACSRCQIIWWAGRQAAQGVCPSRQETSHTSGRPEHRVWLELSG